MLQQEMRDYNNSANETPIATDDISDLIRSINLKIGSAISLQKTDEFIEEDKKEKNNANAATISKKLDECNSLLNELKNLKPIYQKKAIMIVRSWLKRFYRSLIENAIREDWVDNRWLDLLARRKLPDLDYLKSFHDKIAVLKIKTAQFSGPVKQYFDSELDEEEKAFLKSDDETPENHNNEIIRYIAEEMDYAIANPGVAEYSLNITGGVARIGLLKKIQSFREMAEEINAILDNIDDWENLLRKYNFLNEYDEKYFRDIKDIKDIHLGLKQNEVTYERLRQLLIPSWDNQTRSKLDMIPKLQWFDEQIAPLLNENRKQEFASLFVWKLDLTNDEFISRVKGYLMVFNSLIESDTFNEKTRGHFAKNVKETLENFCIEEIILNGANPDEVLNQIKDEFKKVDNSACVTVNVHRSNLEKIYNDGELKTYHELEEMKREEGLFGQTNYGKRRKEKDSQLKYGEDRFIAGALSSENGYDEFIGTAPFYGHGVIELKWDNIKNRIFFVECDSMARDDSDDVKRIMPEWLSKKWKNLDSRKLDYDGAKFVKALMEVYLKRHGYTHIHNMYVEAHIVQPVTTDDFNKVSYAVLSTDNEKEDDKKRKELEDLRDTLAKTNPNGPTLEIIEPDLDLRVKDDPWREGSQQDNIRNDKGF